MRNSLYSVSIEEALENIGGHGKYQKYVFATVFLAWTAWAGALFTLRYSVIRGSITDLDEMEYLVYIYTGGLLGALAACPLLDLAGRRQVFLASHVLALFSLLLIVFGVTLNVTVFVLGLCVGGNLPAGFLLLTEAVEVKYRAVFACLLFSSQGLSLLLSSVLSSVVESFEVESLCWVLSAAFALLLSVKLQESPRFQAAVQGKYTESRRILSAIAFSNGRPKFTEVLEGEKVIGNQELADATVQVRRSRKYTYIHTTDTRITVTSEDLTTEKKTNVFNLCLLKSIRIQVTLLMLVGLTAALAQEILEEAVQLYHSVGLVTAVALLMVLSQGICCLLVETGTRGFGLLILLGTSSVTSVISISFTSAAFAVLELSLLVTSLLSVQCSQVCIFLLTSESLATSVRSCSFYYLMTGIYLGKLLFHCIPPTNGMLIGGVVSMAGSLLIFYLLDKDTRRMEDYSEEDKSEMSKPAEGSALGKLSDGLDVVTNEG